MTLGMFLRSCSRRKGRTTFPVLQFCRTRSTLPLDRRPSASEAKRDEKEGQPIPRAGNEDEPTEFSREFLIRRYERGLNGETNMDATMRFEGLKREYERYRRQRLYRGLALRGVTNRKPRRLTKNQYQRFQGYKRTGKVDVGPPNQPIYVKLKSGEYMRKDILDWTQRQRIGEAFLGLSKVAIQEDMITKYEDQIHIKYPSNIHDTNFFNKDVDGRFEKKYRNTESTQWENVGIDQGIIYEAERDDINKEINANELGLDSISELNDNLDHNYDDIKCYSLKELHEMSSPGIRNLLESVGESPNLRENVDLAKQFWDWQSIREALLQGDVDCQPLLSAISEIFRQYDSMADSLRKMSSLSFVFEKLMSKYRIPSIERRSEVMRKRVQYLTSLVKGPTIPEIRDTLDRIRWKINEHLETKTELEEQLKQYYLKEHKRAQKAANNLLGDIQSDIFDGSSAGQEGGDTPKKDEPVFKNSWDLEVLRGLLSKINDDIKSLENDKQKLLHGMPAHLRHNKQKLLHPFDNDELHSHPDVDPLTTSIRKKFEDEEYEMEWNDYKYTEHAPFIDRDRPVHQAETLAAEGKTDWRDTNPDHWLRYAPHNWRQLEKDFLRTVDMEDRVWRHHELTTGRERPPYVGRVRFEPEEPETDAEKGIDKWNFEKHYTLWEEMNENRREWTRAVLKNEPPDKRMMLPLPGDHTEAKDRLRKKWLRSQGVSDLAESLKLLETENYEADNEVEEAFSKELVGIYQKQVDDQKEAIILKQKKGDYLPTIEEADELNLARGFDEDFAKEVVEMWNRPVFFNMLGDHYNPYRDVPPTYDIPLQKKRGEVDVDVKYEYDDFSGDSYRESIVAFFLHHNRPGKMDKSGRVTRYNSMWVAGNRRGAVGFGLGRAATLQDANVKAREMATNHMIAIPRYRGKSLFHHLRGKFNRTRVFITATPPGFGVNGPNILRAILECAGIQDATAWVTGRRNPYSIVKACFHALSQARDLEDISWSRGCRVADMVPAVDGYSYHLPAGFHRSNLDKAQQILEDYQKHRPGVFTPYEPKGADVAKRRHRSEFQSAVAQARQGRNDWSSEMEYDAEREASMVDELSEDDLVYYGYAQEAEEGKYDYLTQWYKRQNYHSTMFLRKQQQQDASSAINVSNS